MSHFVIKCNELLRYCYKPKIKKKKKGAKDVYLLKKQGISKRCFIISSAHVRCGSFISVFTGLHNQGELNTLFMFWFSFSVPYDLYFIFDVKSSMTPQTKPTNICWIMEEKQWMNYRTISVLFVPFQSTHVPGIMEQLTRVHSIRLNNKSILALCRNWSICHATRMALQHVKTIVLVDSWVYLKVVRNSMKLCYRNNRIIQFAIES